MALTLKKQLLEALGVSWGDELELTLFDNVLVLRPRGAVLSGETVAEAIELFGDEEAPWAGPLTREAVRAVQALGTATVKQVVERTGFEYRQTLDLLIDGRDKGFLVSPERGLWTVVESAKELL